MICFLGGAGYQMVCEGRFSDLRPDCNFPERMIQ